MTLEGAMMANGSKPISLYPLTPEEALRRAMLAPVPSKSDYKPPDKPKAEHKPKPTTKGKNAVKKKGRSQ
jgi:hypothetical protein